MENAGLVMHFRDGRFNVYLTVKDCKKYLDENPEKHITWKLRR